MVRKSRQRKQSIPQSQSPNAAPSSGRPSPEAAPATPPHQNASPTSPVSAKHTTRPSNHHHPPLVIPSPLLEQPFSPGHILRSPTGAVRLHRARSHSPPLLTPVRSKKARLESTTATAMPSPNLQTTPSNQYQQNQYHESPSGLQVREPSGEPVACSTCGTGLLIGHNHDHQLQIHRHHRSRLRPSLQWLLALTLTAAALMLVPRQLLEEAPLSVSELLPEGLMGGLPRLNVTLSMPPLSIPLPLPRPLPSLDLLLSGTNVVNGSLLIGLTDTLTDITDSLKGGGQALTAQLRMLLSQLPAFSLPALTGLGGGNVSAAEGGGGGSSRPGVVMARRGYRAKHPVVIVPGFVTSGLELWRGLPCGQRYFRQRMWGTLAMVQAFLTDPDCWFRHMELDPETGLDPEGIKLRASVGLEAVDYFIQGYWVWGKLVEALADVGYDSNSLVSMPYDWRLAMPLLEERDGYFTRLRSTVEGLVEVAGERVVITAHSYGENVVRSFMSWVEAERSGWVEHHVAGMINIAGTSLGVPKSVSALLSGETRDTAQLGALAAFLTSNLVPRAARTRVWRTWGSTYAMLPVGGSRVWGNATWAPDDTTRMREERRTYGAMVSLWPHNWQSLLGAAASAPPERRHALHRLISDVGEAAEAGAGGPEVEVEVQGLVEKVAAEVVAAAGGKGGVSEGREEHGERTQAPGRQGREEGQGREAGQGAGHGFNLHGCRDHTEQCDRACSSGGGASSGGGFCGTTASTATHRNDGGGMGGMENGICRAVGWPYKPPGTEGDGSCEAVGAGGGGSGGGGEASGTAGICSLDDADGKPNQYLITGRRDGVPSTGLTANRAPTTSSGAACSSGDKLSGICSGSSGSSSGSSGSPMSRITDTLKKLVSSGQGPPVDPLHHLKSEKISRLDVSGFLDLLREVGGPLVERHTQEWGAVELGTEQAAKSESLIRDSALHTAATSPGPSPQADQALGGPQRLSRTARRRPALFPDATRTPLPYAPSTTLVCLYGVGIPTERGYHYLKPTPPAGTATSATATGDNAPAGEADDGTMDTRKTPVVDTAEAGVETEAEAELVGRGGDRGGGGGGGGKRARGSGGGDEGGGGGGGSTSTAAPPHSDRASGEEANPDAGPDSNSGWMIMRDVSQPEGQLDVGVHLGDGDGTVPLLSLGAMCRGGWLLPGSRLNPGGMRVVTREFKHRSVSMLQDARGGPATAAHVEILGNEGVLADVIRVAAGRAEELRDEIMSDIDRIAAAVEW